MAIGSEAAPGSPPLPTVSGANNVVLVGSPKAFTEAVARTLGKGPDALIGVPNISVAEGLLVAAGDRIDVLVVSPDVVPTDASSDLAEFMRERSLGTSIVLARYAPVLGPASSSWPRSRGSVRWSGSRTSTTRLPNFARPSASRDVGPGITGTSPSEPRDFAPSTLSRQWRTYTPPSHEARLDPIAAQMAWD